MRVIVLSGPVVGGKTSLAQSLHHRFGFRIIKTRELITAARPRVREERRSLQRAGDRLDRETDGAWVADQLARHTMDLAPDATVILDSARIQEQIDGIRRAFGRQTVHIHVTAPEGVLEARYAARHGSVAELPSYAEVRQNRTERRVERLATTADIVINSARCTPADVFVRAASALRLYGAGDTRLVDVLIGGQWGSEGKGHVVSYLAPEYDLLVRVGGPNAGHKVYEGEGSTYTFHLLPSGTRACSAALLIGPGATLRVPVLLKEIADCEVQVGRLWIDPQALIISDADIAAETALREGIGSTAQGVGAAAARRIMGRLPGKVQLARDTPELQPYLREAVSVLDDAYRGGKRVLLEGTQGSDLSLFHGQYPYVTSRDTTVGGLCAEAGVAPHRVRRVVMVCRTYPIRVQSPPDGTSGPMGIEITWADVAQRANIDPVTLADTERTSTTHRERRVAEFGWEQLRKSTTLNAPTDIALTFTDYLTASNENARRYEQLDPDTIGFIEEVERVACAPVSLITTRFHHRSIIDRRHWRGS